MQPGRIPDNEAERIAALQALDVLDSEPEPDFDHLVRLASTVCEVPMSLISLVDIERQWFKANIGIPGVTETPRDMAFCAHAILDEEIFEVPDARRDERFADNPLVTSGPEIGFYAGAPIVMGDGSRIGTLCVLDHGPRELSIKQREVLSQLAKVVSETLEKRKSVRAAKAIALRLADSEARMRVLSDTVPLGIFEFGFNGDCTYANARWLGIFQLDKTSWTGARWLQVVHADDRAQLLKAMASQIDSLRVEFRVVGAESAVRHIEMRAKLLVDSTGAPTHYVGCTEDITDDLAHAEGLRRSKDLLERIGALAGVGGWEINLANRRFAFSAQACRILGMPIDFAPTVDEALALYSPQSAREFSQAFERCLTQREPIDMKMSLTRADGEPLWVKIQGKLVDEAFNRPEHMLGSIWDITEQHRADQEIKAAQKRIELATASGGVGIWEWHLSSEVLVWDPQMFNLYHLDPSTTQPTFTLWQNCLHPDDRERTVSEFRRAALTGETLSTEFRVVWEDDCVRHMRCMGQVQCDKEGRPVSMVGTNWDVTAANVQAQMLEAARQKADLANSAKSEFLSSMSHELRTPLNAIFGFAQLLDYDLGADSEHHENVHEILRASRHLLSLINEILDLAKVESGHVELFMEPVRVVEVLGECLQLIAPMASAAQIEVRIAALDPWAELAIKVDRMRFKQVLLNLLSNAIKYNKPNGYIALQIRQDAALGVDEPGLVSIDVIDSGLGIGADDMDKLFMPFNRLSRENAEIEGTGIGLSITKRLVELMHGQIQVTSVLAQGSTFTVSMPSAQLPGAQTHAANDEISAAVEDSSHAYLVLSIDDNPVNLKIIEQTLSIRGNIKVIAAHLPQLGLDLARAHSPQLILLDISMPDMDGFEVLRLLRADPKTASIPVIAVTANAMRRDMDRGLAAGFDAYLTKPLDLGLFLETVNKLLKSPQQAGV